MNKFDTITIEEATECLIDYRGKTPPKTNSGIRLITARVIKDGRILEEPKEFIAEDYYDEWMGRGLPQQYDVLLTTEAPLGETAILRYPEKVALAQRVILLRAKKGKVHPLYLLYSLQSTFTQSELLSRSSGTTVIGIRQNELRQVRIPIFPYTTQCKIAAILSSYDDLIENNLRRIKILEEMAQALYREWFVHYRFPGHEKVRLVDSPLGKIPEGWEVMNLGDLLIDHIGGGWGKEEKDSKHTCQAFVIRGTDIPHVKFIDIGNCPLRFHSESNLCSRKLQPGDLVYEVSGGGKEQPVGRVLLITEKILAAFPGDVICASFCKRMTPNVDYINPLILFYHLDNLYKSERINQYQVQSTGIKNLKFSILLENEFVTVPLLKLQNQFIEIISPIKEAQENFALRNTVIRRTRDLLLPKLISGELDVSRLDIKIPEELD